MLVFMFIHFCSYVLFNLFLTSDNDYIHYQPVPDQGVHILESQGKNNWSWN